MDRNKHSALKRLAFAGAMVSALATSQAALAGPQAGGSYRLRATVPVACWVRPASPMHVHAGQTGSVVEACNSPGGFTISASYRALASTEKARLSYGDITLDLARSGQQVLRRSSMATIRTVDYRFEDVSLDGPLILALTIQPI